ncbi:MAG: DNA repair protein RecN [Candidatus Sericytochromatia bacterium]|nr:DNA repair protein RecN [Candidatus Sericytochromatia bacterium]
MLLRLQVHQFVLVESLDLELAAGLTVLTGETGAGKSVLLAALAAGLGGRVSPEVIRPGATKALVELTFVAEGSWWESWREENGLAALEPGRVVLSREITAGGSRARVDGQSVHVATLRDLGQRLVAMSGQHDHVRLMSPATQREILDAYGGLGSLVRAVGRTYESWVELGEAERQTREAAVRRAAERDFLAFQLAELEAADLEDPDEDLRLRERLQVQRQQARLAEGAGQARVALDEALDGALGTAGTLLRQLVGVDARLQGVLELIESAAVHVGEASDALRRYLERDLGDAEGLDVLEARFHLLSGLVRRHGGSLSHVMARRADLQRQLAEAEGDEERLADLANRRDQAAVAWDREAAVLTAARHEAAVSLTERLSSLLAGLGLPLARLEVGLVPGPERGPFGAEDIQWIFSAQPDAPLRQLGRVASGGELARILLAVQVAMQGRHAMPTLVFDEIDTGISGEAAAAVGRQLARMAATDQVLAVTHLPAVAAGAARHLHLRKVIADGRTRLGIEDLNEERSIRVLAEMLAGDAPAEGALKAARELRLRARDVQEGASHGVASA